MVSDKDLRERYWADGWVVVADVFTVSEVERVRALAMAIVEDADETDERSGDSGIMREAVATGAPRKIGQPFWRHSDFRVFVLQPRLTRLIECLIGQPPSIFGDQIFLKPPRHGSAKPYHQDNAYFLWEPADTVVTAWIALDDVDAENGCLRYIDGSHRAPLLAHEPVPGAEHNLTPAAAEIDLSRESLAPVKKGGVVFHHGSVLHTSHANESDRWRRGYASHWVTQDSISPKESVMQSAYFRQQNFSEIGASVS